MGNKSSTPTPRERASTPSSHHQDSLLKLLNRTAVGSESPQLSNERQSSSSLAHGMDRNSLEDQTERQQSPIRFFGEKENKKPTAFQPQDIPQGSPSQHIGSAAYINPFEGQSALPPRQAIRKSSANGGGSKRIKSQSPVAGHTTSRRKLTPAGDEVLQSIETSGAEAPKDGRTPVEALMGIGAPSRDAETVAQALNEVGDQVDRQVGDALAKAESKEREAEIKREEDASAEKAKFNAIEDHVHSAAVGLKSELEKVENKNVLTDVMPTEAAEAVKDIIDDAAQEKEDVNNNELARQIKVYQFPMRPFVSIDLVQREAPELTLREGSAVPIARFKKEFDQSDRTLATATNDFIAYAVPKNNGGIRVIEQDSGKSSLLFGDSQDRVFNIGISTSANPQTPGHGLQRVIATGVSGAVYWATIAEPDTELSQEGMQQTSVIFPPTSAGSDSTSGGQLKTRAKKSSRSPEFLAIGRGKAIQIVFPMHARNSDFFDSTTSKLDSEKYFADRSLKITTGKAGKDFTFSEDDTTIVTLDKAGKLRIWDIRELTDMANSTASRLAPIEVTNPLLTFATTSASEKSWPTSVLFVDKLRPYSKGTALRYIVVGMKQNHTLQLWDLCLGKAVQEINFPHEKETDAICSVAYHAVSGVIAVGHPTRNSIYFIHLSAPKYNLPSMSQAKFVQRLASKDATLPKAEATAIMSGMREYSLSDKGQLRSIELNPSSGEVPRVNVDDEDPALFELYVMHSKGLHCLSIKKEDLGWSQESRVQHPIDAELNGVVIVKELRESPSVNSSEQSTRSLNGEDEIAALVALNPLKPPASDGSKADRSETITQSSRELEKKKNNNNKRNGATETPSRSALGSGTSDSYAQKASTNASQPNQSTTKESSRPSVSKQASIGAPETVPASVQDRAKTAISSGDTVSVGISGDFLDKELKKVEQGVSNVFTEVLGRELASLYKQVAEDRRVQDASGAAKQEAVLRLVSSTLGDNVEKNLTRIVQKSIQETVLPSLGGLVTAAMTKHLNATISQQIQNAVPAAVKQAMDGTVKRSMQSPDMFRAISEQVSKTVAAHIDREFTNAMAKTIAPSFQNVATSVAQKITGDTERRVHEQIVQVEANRQSDSAKIDQLTALVTGMSNTLSAMAEAQSQFQNKILELQQQIARSGPSPTPSDSASHQVQYVSPEQEELQAVTEVWDKGDHEEATVMVSIILSTRSSYMILTRFLVASIATTSGSV